MSSALPQPCQPALRAYSAPSTSAVAAQATGIPHIHHTRHNFSDLIASTEMKRGPQAPFKWKWHVLQAGVLLRHHAEEHRDRQHRVDARGHAGALGGGGFFLRAHRDDAERL